MGLSFLRQLKADYEYQPKAHHVLAFLVTRDTLRRKYVGGPYLGVMSDRLHINRRGNWVILPVATLKVSEQKPSFHKQVRLAENISNFKYL